MSVASILMAVVTVAPIQSDRTHAAVEVDTDWPLIDTPVKVSTSHDIIAN